MIKAGHHYQENLLSFSSAEVAYGERVSLYLQVIGKKDINLKYINVNKCCFTVKKVPQL